MNYRCGCVCATLCLSEKTRCAQDLRRSLQLAQQRWTSSSGQSWCSGQSSFWSEWTTVTEKKETSHDLRWSWYNCSASQHHPHQCCCHYITRVVMSGIKTKQKQTFGGSDFSELSVSCDPWPPHSVQGHVTNHRLSIQTVQSARRHDKWQPSSGMLLPWWRWQTETSLSVRTGGDAQYEVSQHWYWQHMPGYDWTSSVNQGHTPEQLSDHSNIVPKRRTMCHYCELCH